MYGTSASKSTHAWAREAIAGSDHADRGFRSRSGDGRRDGPPPKGEQMTGARSLVALVITLAAIPAPGTDHPIAGDSLILADPPSDADRKLRFKATRDAAIAPAEAGDPRAVGATLEVTGTASGNGATGPLALDASLWT